MLVKKFDEQKEIVAGDNCVLRELLSGLRDEVECRHSIAYAKVPVGQTTWKHALKTTEIYYIVAGKGTMYIGEEIEEVGPRDTIYIPPNAVQCIENIGDTELEFLAIVDPAWRAEDEVII